MAAGLLSLAVASPLAAQTPSPSAPAAIAPQAFSFGLWGDMPYAKANDLPKLPTLIDSMNRSNILFSLFDGDIKDGSSKCTNDVYTTALETFSKFLKPVVYIPGDNEWTDCHRINNGGYDSNERLAHIRKVMYPTMDSFGQTRMPLEHQGKEGEKFVENIRFVHGNIVFAGLNIPGSNNNKVMDDKDCTKKSVRTPQVCVATNAEYEERDKANIAWMMEAFQKARDAKSPGIVLVWQGEPGFDLPETEELDERKNPMSSGYTNFLNALVAETEKFAGQVLIVHGEIHAFKVDKPLYNPAKILPNLTRISTFGSPLVHWVKVDVDPASVNVFTIQPVIVKHD